MSDIDNDLNIQEDDDLVELDDNSLEDNPSNVQDDTNSNSNEIDEENEAIQRRGANAEKNRRKKENMRAKLDRAEKLEIEYYRMQKEMEESKAKLARLEGLANQFESSGFDTEIKQTENMINYLNNKLKESWNAADGETAVQLQDQLFEAKLRYKELKNHANTRSSQPVQQPSAQQIDPVIQRLGNEFIQDKPWIKNPVTHEEKELSQVAHFLDAQLSREGYDPRDPRYWSELESRLNERLGISPNNKPSTTTKVPPSNSRGVSKVGASDKINMKGITKAHAEILEARGIGTMNGTKFVPTKGQEQKLQAYLKTWRENGSLK